MPMGCAPMGYLLWNEVMKYNPKNPDFWNRDRFVLSAGHGSMFQYSMLHLTGYDSVPVSLIAWPTAAALALLLGLASAYMSCCKRCDPDPVCPNCCCLEQFIPAAGAGEGLPPVGLPYPRPPGELRDPGC
jgi:hypothetical protein